MISIQKMLNALGFISEEKLDLSNYQQVFQIIYLIETEKIQQIPEIELIQFKNNLENKLENKKILENYLKKLNCPNFTIELIFKENKINNQILLYWILSYSISQEYKSKINNETNSNSQEMQIEFNQNQLKNQNNINDSQFYQKINQLFFIPKIQHFTDKISNLQAIRNLIQSTFLFFEEQKAIQSQNNKNIQNINLLPETEIKRRRTKNTSQNNKIQKDKKSYEKIKIESISLGFEIQNKKISQALKIARLLFLQDLRNLQTLSNHLISSCQELTTNVVLNHKIGKVGF
ncbi:RNA transcription translation and transport factor protein [Anaeramoeba ignava]|uniref:RNA transcription translation and transport factor protein n=1 Tax=Anaeramoeba ignava TaxID=1746090 RepID=A0A9Q0REH5_ANAIG|nr:RNA transcription translation and transport factor protein [Anaeramoeba ignava]